MAQRFSGKDVIVSLSETGILARVKEVSLTTEDNIAVVSSGGYPDGWVAGEVTGEGELQVQAEELAKFLAAAEVAGSWEAMAAMDLTLYASTLEGEWKVEAYGCKLKMPSVSVDRGGGEALMHTIAFVITSPEFVRINGIPLAGRNA